MLKTCPTVHLDRATAFVCVHVSEPDGRFIYWHQAEPDDPGDSGWSGACEPCLDACMANEPDADDRLEFVCLHCLKELGVQPGVTDAP